MTHPPTFTIIIDTREQLPFDFSAFRVPTVRQALPSGDYSIAGLEHRVAVERKARGDLLSCMAGGRERFVRELERLQALEFSAVVCEGDLPMLLSGQHSRMNPKSIVATLFAWMQRYPRTHWLLMPSRPWAERATFLLLERFFRDVQDGKRPQKQETAA